MTLRTVFRTTNTWDQGFSAEILIINDGPEMVTDWRLAFTAPWTIQSFWNAAGLIGPTGVIRFGNVDMNSTLAPGQSANIGFTAVGQPAPPVFLDAEKPSWEVPPALTVTDAWTVESNSGTSPLVFELTLSHASATPVSIRWETASTDGAAAARTSSVRSDP